jgi:exopolyphosphatase / guanosine-5'-triphosphate,3'-diphosphate pyrophosphatase
MIMMKKLAIIDMGTNTFHLLMAEWAGNQYQITYREKLAVRIGQGGINKDIIQADAIERALTALKIFHSKIVESGIEKTFAFATSALRNASNVQEVVNKIKEATGIDVTIISGDEEAELIYRGVRTAVPLGVEPSVIIDIGGGSVEFIIANENELLWKRSYEIGGQRLLERFQKKDPIAHTEIGLLNSYFDETLSELFDALKKYYPTTLVGSSGSFDTLSDIHCIKNHIPKNENDAETPLTIDSFYEIYQQLIRKNRAERMLIPGMIELRVDMIVVAVCLIRFILEKHPFKNIRVSSYALKEGVLYALT